MDRTTLAEGLLALAESKGMELSDDLGELEQQLRELAHEVGAQATELHLNARKPGYEGSSRPCPACGKRQKFVGHRPRTLETLLGQVTFRRAYYRCPHCRQTSLPFDERQGLGRQPFTPEAAKAATRCAADEPFEGAAEKVRELTGIRISKSALHRLTHRVGGEASRMEQASEPESSKVEAEPERLYIAVDGAKAYIDGRWQEVKVVTCYWEDERGDRQARYRVRHDRIADAVAYIESLARRCGHDQAHESILLGDGAPWIWQRVGEALGPHTVHITDWYHVMEHVWDCGKTLFGDGSDATEAWVKRIETMLWEGQLRKLRQHLDDERSKAPDESAREAIEGLAAYIQRQGDRLVYDDFRAAGYDIGSGRVEAACKNVVAKRAKGSGMQWSAQGLQATLSLRCCYLNGHGEELWRRHPLAA